MYTKLHTNIHILYANNNKKQIPKLVHFQRADSKKKIHKAYV